MNDDEFIGINDELNEETLKKYEELAERDDKDSNDTNNNKEITSSGCPLIPRVVNIVACVEYGVPFDLNKIATHLRNAEFNPKRFPAATIRIQEPKATALAFKNGKVNIVGCTTEDDAYLSARKFGRIFKNLGFNVQMKSFNIANIVATMNCQFPIHLESLASSKHKLFCTYNPEVFSGLIYRVNQRPKCTFLVFVSGKIIVTGAKKIEHIHSAINYLYPILQQYARNFQGKDDDDDQ